MNLKVKTIAAAAAVAALSVAGHASATAISNDHILDGVAQGDGSGNLFLTVVDTTNNTGFILNLGRNVLNDVQSPTDWSVTSSALQAYIAGGDAANMRWNVAGITNFDADFNYPLPDVGMVTTNQGQTDFGADGFSNMFFGLTNLGNYTTAANGLLSSSDSASGSLASLGNASPSANEYNGSFGWLTFDNRATGFGASQLFSYVSSPGDSSADPNIPELVTLLGSIGIDSSTGKVTFTATGASAVPVPAAIWLFGSALMGLSGIARRRRGVVSTATA